MLIIYHGSMLEAKASTVKRTTRTLSIHARDLLPLARLAVHRLSVLDSEQVESVALSSVD